MPLAREGEGLFQPMDENLKRLHLEAGRVAGREKTCGKKHAYLSEAAAHEAADSHNMWEDRRHDVEPYPCAFCGKWHIGGIMSPRALEAVARRSPNIDATDPSQTTWT